MNKLYLVIIFTFFWASLSAQDGTMTNTGDEITILSGTPVHIRGSYQDKSGDTLFNGQPYEGTLANGDTVYIGGDVVNEAGEGIFLGDYGTVILDGDTIQLIKGDSPVVFHNLILDKDTALVPYQYFEVTDSLYLISGYVNLDSVISGVNLGNFGTLYGENNDNRFFGNLGKLIAEDRLVSGAGNDDIAGMGISIAANGSLGSTTIERQTGSQGGAADGGIDRYYHITPTNKNQDLSSVLFEYFDAQIKDFNEEKFAFWHSTNRGVVWNRHKYELNTASNQITGKNITLGNASDLLTVADSICVDGPLIQLAARDTIAICEGDPVILDAQNPGLFFLWNTGATTQRIEVATPGDYMVQVWDANGCFNRDTVTLITKPYPEVDFTRAYVCNGDSSEFVNLSTIAEGKMTYHWDFGVDGTRSDTSNLESPKFLYSEAGQYTVTLTVSSELGCTVTKDTTYVIHPKPVASVAIQDVCKEASSEFSSTSTVLESIGALNYGIVDYQWDFGIEDSESEISSEENPNFVYAAAGTYTGQLKIETNAGCIDSTAFTTTINPLPEPEFTADFVCYGKDIAIRNQSVIESGSMAYSWGFADGSSSHFETPEKVFESAGAYEITLTATSALGCVDSVKRTITAYDIPNARFSVDDQCIGATLDLENLSSSGSGDDLTYSWDFDDGTSSTEPVPQKSYTEAGEYRITLSVSSPHGCTDDTTVVYTAWPVPVADFSANDVCDGSTMKFTNKSSVADGTLSYVWHFGDGTTSTERATIHTYASSGSYTVSLEVTTGTGCIQQTSRAVTVFNMPVVDLPSETATCGDQYVLDAGNAGATYLWSNGATSQTITVSRTGTYAVTVTSPSGCSVSHSTTISFENAFSPNLPESIVSCEVATLDAGNASALSYLWSTGETTRAIDVTAPGTYSVTVVDQNGCEGTDEIAVTINEFPIVDLGADIFLCSINLPVLTAGNDGATFLWSTGETTRDITATQSGSYSVSVTNASGCTSTGEITVTLYDTPAVDLGTDGQACDVINLNAGNLGATYLWSDGSTAQTYSGTESGLVWVEATNAQGCSARDSVRLEIVPVPVLDFGQSQSICSGESITLDAENEGSSYLWSTGAITQSIEVTATGDYHVTVTNTLGCSITDKIFIQVQPKVSVNLGEDKRVCAGSKVTFDAAIPAASYSWIGSNGFTSSASSITVSEAGIYRLTAETAYGCVGIDSVMLQVAKDTLEANYLVVSDIYVNDTVQFVNLSSPDSLVYLWQFGDGTISRTEDPTHIYLREGVYHTILTVSKDVCQNEYAKSITVATKEAGRSGEELEVHNPFDSQFIADTIASSSVFPNPVEDKFKLRVDKAKGSSVLLVFYNGNGRLIKMEQYADVTTLEKEYDFSALPSGIYYLAIRTREDEIIKRIIKQ